MQRLQLSKDQTPEPPTKKIKPAGTGDGHRIKRKETVVKPKANKKKKKKTPPPLAEEMEAEEGPESVSDQGSDLPYPPAKEGPKVGSC